MEPVFSVWALLYIFELCEVVLLVEGDVEPYLVVLRAYSWIYAQGSLLVILRGLYVVLGTEPGQPCTRQMPYPL